MLACDPAREALGLCRVVTSGDFSALINIDLACPGNSTNLRKPFIILDGIDFFWRENSFDFNRLLLDEDRGLRFRDESVFPQGANPSLTLGEILEAAGYDVILIDYFDHHARIQDNAAVVQEVIRQINNLLQVNGSDEPIRMMGISMGAVVGKYALLHMESNEETHNVDKYFTFDGPMQGANVPLCIQAPLQHILSIRPPAVATSIIPPFVHIVRGPQLRFQPEFDAITDFERVLSSDAARQLAIHNIYDEGAVMHKAFFAELESLGELHECEIFAISNGSDRGTNGRQPLIDDIGGFIDAGDIIYDIDDDEIFGFQLPLFLAETGLTAIEGTQGLTNPLFMLSAIVSFFQDNVNADLVGRAAGGPAGSTIYDGDLEMSVLFGLVDYMPDAHLENESDTKALDGVPGGTFGEVTTGGGIGSFSLIVKMVIRLY